MLQPKIIMLRAESLYKLYLEYETGEKKLFDVTPYITGKWYEELKDEDYFRTVSLLPGGTGIEWEHGQDIAPHELYEMSELVSG